jgi:hypothetical protein
MIVMSVLEFHDFCEKVLSLHLTTGQRVVAKVGFGNYDPIDLPEDERNLALEMFGGLERVPKESRKYILLRFGRGSGKTTLCSAFSVYEAVTHDIGKCGPGDVPYVIVVAPDKETAKLSIRMSREMIRSQPALERLLVNDTDQMIQLRRPDGRMVRIESFAATRGGSSMRGRTIIAFLMDEAEFFTSSGDGKDYAVNDKDIFRALKPRLLPDGKGMLISTPWPVETLMSEMFDENWCKCKTAVAIKASTVLVRGDDPDIRAMVDDEMTKDPENARRELFCELDGFTGGEFFDANALNTSLEEYQRYPEPFNVKFPVAVGCDLGFTRDSSAIVVCQYDGHKYRVVFADELRPKPGKPLKPGEVIKHFSEVAKRYGAYGVVADSYYRESLKEHLAAHNLVVIDAPEGTKGKAQVFQRTRAALHEGLCSIPDVPIGRRLSQQAKMVVSKAAPGGTTTIKVPRKIGMGHGDIASAWVLAVWKLAYAQIEREKVIHEPGTRGWVTETNRRLAEWQEKQQREYLKNLEKEVRGTMTPRRLAAFRLGLNSG